MPDEDGNPTSEEVMNQTYAELFRTPQGHVVFNDLLKFTCFMQTSHNPVNPNAYQSAFLEGHRNVFAYIMGRVKPEHSAETVAQMAQEAYLTGTTT